MPSAHRSTLDLAARLGVHADRCRVVATRELSPSLREIVLHGDPRLVGEPGRDVMVRVSDAERSTRRRYSVRWADASTHRFGLWVSVAHEGPGANWARQAVVDQPVDVVGPRGKIGLAANAPWHLFVGDLTALAAAYRLAESIQVPGRALFVLEIADDADAVTAAFDPGLGVTGIFVDRRDRAPSDPTGLISALTAVELPPGDGHAYVFAEAGVGRAVRAALATRGLSAEAISHKAYWRAGRRNAENGEPERD